MVFSECIKGFGREVLERFSYLVAAEYPLGVKESVDVDLIDIELFCDKYCVAYGADGIAHYVVKEFDRRKSFFDVISNDEAREFAVDALRNTFFNNGVSFVKSDSFYSTAGDWLSENFVIVNIYREDGADVEPLEFMFDFSSLKVDYPSYIGIDYPLDNIFGKVEEIISSR